MPDYKPTSIGTQLVSDASDRLSSLGDFLQKQGLAKAQQGLEKQKLQNERDMPKLTAQAQGSAKDADITRLQGMKDSGLVEPGGTAKVGEVSTGADPYAKMLNQQHQREANQGGKLYATATKAAAPIQGQLDALEGMHTLLDNPNSVDQKQLGAMGARLTEGSGQRLLQSLVQTLGAPSSIAGDANKAANYVLGAAKSGLTPQQTNAFRENLFKHQALLEGQASDAQKQVMQAGSLIAPDLGPEKSQAAASMAFEHSNGVLSRLKQRQVGYAQSGGGMQPGAQPAQHSQPPQGVGGWLKSLIPGMGGEQSPQAPQAAQSGGQQGGQRPIKTLRNMRTGETKQVYGDTGEDVPNGQ